MKGSPKLSYKQIQARLQRQKQQKLKAAAQRKGLSPVVKCCYQISKLVICLFIFFSISITLLILLGSNGTQGQQKIFQLLRKDNQLSKSRSQLQALLKKQTQSSYQNLINIHLPKFEENGQSNENELKDLSLAAKFALNSIDSKSKIATLPLNSKCVQWCGFVSQPLTSKGLKLFKQLLKKVLTYLNVKQPSKKKNSQDQCILQTLKQLIAKGKYSKIKQVVTNQLWDFVNERQNYILYWKNDNKQIQNKKQILKSFKKWVKQHDQSIIFVLSETSISQAIGSDSFKSYELNADFKNVELKSLQEYLPFWNESQVQILHKKIKSFHQLNTFLAFVNTKKGRFDSSLNKQQSQIVDNVCQHNHHKFYFYNGQKSIHKVMKRSNVQSESRWERQFQALKIKLSLLKNWFGISFIEDAYRTFTSNSKISLTKINQKGIQYQFADHQFNWKQNIDKIWYEIQNQIFCGKAPTQVQADIQENEEDQKDKANQEDKVEKDDNKEIQNKQQILQLKQDQNQGQDQVQVQVQVQGQALDQEQGQGQYQDQEQERKDQSVQSEIPQLQEQIQENKADETEEVEQIQSNTQNQEQNKQNFEATEEQEERQANQNADELLDEGTQTDQKQQDNAQLESENNQQETEQSPQVQQTEKQDQVQTNAEEQPKQIQEVQPQVKENSAQLSTQNVGDIINQQQKETEMEKNVQSSEDKIDQKIAGQNQQQASS